MEVQPALALPEGLQVTAIERIDAVLTITAVSAQQQPCCPLYGSPAARIHSCYTRQIADVTCGGQRVCLRVLVRKFFCAVMTCARKIFVERLTCFVAAFAWVTARLHQIVQIIGLATGGRLGVRVTEHLGIQTSRQTILRRIMVLPAASVGQVIELGIDDFSFKRGRTFGTILVDLQSHHVFDVLPDRKVQTASAWMSVHPEIELVSRDRSGDYAAAAASGVPQARQCADRFHLLKNLEEARDRCLARHFAVHRQAQLEHLSPTPLETAQPNPPKQRPKEAELSQAKREENLARYQQVVALRQRGFSQVAIAERVGVGHATVARWLGSSTFPEQQPRPRKTRLDPHLKEVAHRWEAGCRNIAQSHRELVADGATLSYKVVYKQLVRYLPDGRKNAQRPDQLPQPPVLARQAVFLFPSSA